jgi:hypothetical protein
MRTLTILLAFCCATAASAIAQGLDAGIAAVPVPLSATVRQEEVAYDVPRYTVSVTQGTNNFAMRVPVGFYLRNDPASGTMVLANRDGNCSISFSALRPVSDDAPAFTADDYRNTVLRENPSAAITSEFSRGTALGAGFGYDLQLKAVRGFSESKRIMYFSSPAGLLVITGKTSRDQFTSFTHVLDGFIMSIQCSTTGRVTLPPLIDKS